MTRYCVLALLALVALCVCADYECNPFTVGSAAAYDSGDQQLMALRLTYNEGLATEDVQIAYFCPEVDVFTALQVTNWATNTYVQK
ncbi:hypothetical protein KIPB_014260 [Kipferlia bialata]|uniref:Uncharacterized protein n=1 Tax=Kipferlia bialata TaxID=797122 RepID=A0A391P282_9EUKA|nr:hypothetical protein KIPB_014260 [Kipferlia bialata]|eukprot:g14260.t1